MRINIAIERLDSFKLWWVFFFYTFFVSILVQFVILPYVFPYLHAGYGLLNSSFDSIGFHQLAVDLADKIRIHGWSVWQLRPGSQSPAGVASIFYYFILPDPRIFIPISAALHAGAVLILVNLLNSFVKNKAKAIFCILPFLVFPSNLQWTAQWHRDGFSILGVVLILQGMVLSVGLKNDRLKNRFFINFRSIIYYACGFSLIWIARPYIMTIVEPFMKLFFGVLFLSFLIRAFKKKISWQRILIVSLSMLLILFALGQAKMDIGMVEFKECAPVSDNEEEVAGYGVEEAAEPIATAQLMAEKPSIDDKVLIASAKEGARQVINKSKIKKTESSGLKPEVSRGGMFERPLTGRESIKVKGKKLIKQDYIENHWKRSFGLPLSIENKAYSLAIFRRGFRLSAPEAKSNIDSGIGFCSVKDILIYLPRAAQIVFLAPFPDQWFDSGSCTANSLMRRISAFEMIVVYFTLIFLPYTIWHWRKRVEIWIIFIFLTYIMLVHGLVVCNIGSLYRMRYGYIMILVSLGIAGFLAFLDNIKLKKS